MSTMTSPQSMAPPQLERRLRAPRTLVSAALSCLAACMTALALLPLVSVLGMLAVKGGQRLSLSLFTDLPPAPAMPMNEGGIGNAILGTLLMVGIAATLSVPVGILGAVYLAEFGPESRTAHVVRFGARVLTGLPSVLAGLFAYVGVVLLTGTPSAIAGGVALAVLMLPTVLLTAEQAIEAVPRRMKEAAVGLGATPSQVAWYVLLPAALPGILTGVLLAVARAAGETAPLLFTAQFSVYWMTTDPMEPTPSLAVLIYRFSDSPFSNQLSVAWAASLVLVFLILLLNIVAQVWGRQHLQR